MSIEHVLELIAGFLGWAFIAEVRVRKAKSKLVVSEEKNEDCEIDTEDHALNDDELEAVARKHFGGGSKPSA